jgi:hypothetical protein
MLTISVFRYYLVVTVSTLSSTDLLNIFYLVLTVLSVLRYHLYTLSSTDTLSIYYFVLTASLLLSADLLSAYYLVLTVSLH